MFIDLVKETQRIKACGEKVIRSTDRYRSLDLSQGFGICPRNAKKLKGKPFTINQQFPLEVENKRKRLYPVMKRTRDNDHFTRMVRDTLYIDNNLYTPQNGVTEGTNVKEFAVEDQPCTPQNPLRIDKLVNVHGSVLPPISIIRKT